MKPKEFFPAFLLAFFLFCMLLQDLALQSVFGTITKSPVVFIAPMLFIFLIVYERKLHFEKLTRYYFFYAMMGIVISLVILSVTVLFVTNGNLYVYDEYMPFKLVRASMYNITYFFAVYVLSVLLRRVSISTLLWILEFFVYFLFLYGMLQLFFDLRIPFINYTISDESRISLTASEPSNAAPMFLTFATSALGLRYYLKKGLGGSLLIIVITFALLILIGSKGVLLLIPFAIVIAIRKSLNFKIILIVSALLVPLTIIIIKKVLPMLVTDIADFTSFSTRITTIVAMVKSIFLYPFGEGYGTYLLYFPPLLLPTNAQIVHIIGFPLQPGELIDMVNTGKNLPAKSGVGNEIIYNGITAIIFLVLICRYYVKNVRLIPIKSARLIFSFLGLLLLTIFTFNTILETAYFYLLPLVIVPKLVNTGNTP